jgi:AraC-like DNA-binding protein
MPAAFDLPRGFFAENGHRDLRIDGSLRSLVVGSKEHHGRPERQPAAWKRPNLGINLTLRGRGRYIDAGGREHELQPGVLFHRYTSVAHQTWFDIASGYAECFVVFDAATGQRLLESGLISTVPVLNVGVDPVIIDSFRHLAKLVSAPEAELSSRRALLEAVSFVDGLYERARGNRTLGFWERKIEDACLLLGHNLDERLRGETVAKQLGLSYPAFRKRFREATGYSPVDYRIRRRLESAQHMLMVDSVAAVARRFGYSDPYAFSAQFKTFLGVSPREFQRRMQRKLVLVPLITERPPSTPG